MDVLKVFQDEWPVIVAAPLSVLALACAVAALTALGCRAWYRRDIRGLERDIGNLRTKAEGDASEVRAAKATAEFLAKQLEIEQKATESLRADLAKRESRDQILATEIVGIGPEMLVILKKLALGERVTSAASIADHPEEIPKRAALQYLTTSGTAVPETVTSSLSLWKPTAQAMRIYAFVKDGKKTDEKK